jgi:uncharacterized membrane protein YtjA (UPF0391 family)
MLRWILMFLVLAIVAGALGFTNVAGGASALAPTRVYILLILLVLTIVVHLTRGGGTKKDP